MPDPGCGGAEALCSTCYKIAALCVCGTIVPFDNRTSVVVLQHPQEQDRELGTARLAIAHFTNAGFKVGLSWPNLSRAVGRQVEANRWGALYLGPAAKMEGEKRVVTAKSPNKTGAHQLISVLDRHGKSCDPLRTDQKLREIEGIILLDGSWSQAKTLWWRNPWLLKTTRIMLDPAKPSLYGRLRKEPRRESLSTLEAISMIMARLENNQEIETRLITSFQALLRSYRRFKSADKPTLAG